MTSFRINAAGRTDTGPVRTANEDSMILRPEVGLWAVADGMGGHSNGKWAADTVTEALKNAALSGTFDADVRAIGDAVEIVNRRIFDSAEEAGKIMGSTLVIFYLCEDRFAAIWAGDSRAYLCRDGKLLQLTTDHTYVNELIAAGTITAAEAVSHPNAHVVSRAVGVAAELTLDAVSDTALALDKFLLCSDGLTGAVSKDEIVATLNAGAPPEAAAGLLELALAHGASDNVTLIVVGCEEITKIVAAKPESCDA